MFQRPDRSAWLNSQAFLIPIIDRLGDLTNPFSLRLNHIFPFSYIIGAIGVSDQADQDCFAT
jgi:hypothetical protein